MKYFYYLIYFFLTVVFIFRITNICIIYSRKCLYLSVFSDLTDAFEPFKAIMSLVNDKGIVKYGQLVAPNIVNNFGPMYISKITRIN